MDQILDTRNGVGYINTNGVGVEFIGTTAEGSFPPAGRQYSLFSFVPKHGEPGKLAFRYQHTEGKKYIEFYHFWWEGEMLMLKQGIGPTQQAFSRSDELGLTFQAEGCCYVTSTPSDTEREYREIDLIDMLKYLEGKISLKSLERYVRTRRKRKKLEERIAHLEAMLEARGREHGEVIQTWRESFRIAEQISEGTIQDLEQQISQLQTELAQEQQANVKLQSEYDNRTSEYHAEQRRSDIRKSCFNNFRWVLDVFVRIPERMRTKRLNATISAYKTYLGIDEYYIH